MRSWKSARWVHHLSNSKARIEDIEIGLVLSCMAIRLLLEWDRDEYIYMYIYIRPYRAVETSMRYENTATSSSNPHQVYHLTSYFIRVICSHEVEQEWYGQKGEVCSTTWSCLWPEDITAVHLRKTLFAQYLCSYGCKRFFYITKEWQEEYISLKSSRQKEPAVKFD